MVLSFQAREEVSGWKGGEKEYQPEKDFILIMAPQSI